MLDAASVDPLTLSLVLGLPTDGSQAILAVTLRQARDEEPAAALFQIPMLID